jgi:hypothetical protein
MGLTSAEAKKLVANTQAQLRRKAEEATREATAQNPEVPQMNEQGQEQEEQLLNQPVNQVNKNNICCLLKFYLVPSILTLYHCIIHLLCCIGLHPR